MNEQQIVDMYVNQNHSTYTIAKTFNTYPNKIRRIILKNGYQLKDKSEAQRAALKEGRSAHPTEGKKRDPTTKKKISEAVYKYWQNLPKKERQKRVDKSYEQWHNMSEAERQNLRDAAALAVRRASKEGSKMERFLFEEIGKKYQTIFHKKGLIVNEDLEVDLFIPALNVVIEIDGPAHFFPIWGQSSLNKHVKSDAHKSGLLLNAGFIVIRIKHLVKSLSEKHKRDVLSAIINKLEKISKHKPKKHNRYIELEVN